MENKSAQFNELKKVQDLVDNIRKSYHRGWEAVTARNHCNTLIGALNEYIVSVKQVVSEKENLEEFYREEWPHVRAVFVKSFERLKEEVDVPLNRPDVPIQLKGSQPSVSDTTNHLRNQVEALKLTIQRLTLQLQEAENLNRQLEGQANSTSQTLQQQIAEQQEQIQQLEAQLKEMAEFDDELALKLVGCYDGNPSRLEQFIRQVKYLDGRTSDTHKATLKSFVETRLSGKAANVAVGAENLQAIITKLQTHCRSGVTSKVIRARLAATRQKDTSISFTKEVDELAAQLEAAYIEEGVNPEKAAELTMDTAVTTLTNGAKNAQVRLIMKAGNFKTLSEATERVLKEDTGSNEVAQILGIRGVRRYNYNNRNNRGRGRTYNNYRGNGRRSNNNYRNNNRGQRNNYGNSSRQVRITNGNDRGDRGDHQENDHGPQERLGAQAN